MVVILNPIGNRRTAENGYAKHMQYKHTFIGIMHAMITHNVEPIRAKLLPIP